MFLQRWTPDQASRPDLGHVIERGLASPWAFDPWVSFRGQASAPASFEQNDHGVTVRVELPGVDPEHIAVSMEGRQLTIAVEEKQQSESGEGENQVTTHRLSSFRQTFRMPFAVEAENVVAEARHGVLTVKLPKPAEAEPKRIPVSVS